MVPVFFQKNFGVNRTPKNLVNVANFFSKHQLLLPTSCFDEPNFLKHSLCFSADIKRSFTSSRIEPPHLNNFAYKTHPYKIIYFLSISKML